MAEEKAAAAEAPIKMVDVINQGGRTYVTSAGKLAPKCGISLPEAEAVKMLSYRSIVRADSISKAAEGNSALAAENASLKASVKALEGKVAEFMGVQKLADLKDLQAKNGEVAA